MGWGVTEIFKIEWTRRLSFERNITKDETFFPFHKRGKDLLEFHLEDKVHNACDDIPPTNDLNHEF